MMGKMLPCARPEEVGVSSEAIIKLVRDLDCGETEPHGLMMVRHGYVFAEGYWKPYAKGLVHGMQSLSKSWTGTAIGIAIEQGALSLDDSIIDIFQDESVGLKLPYLEQLQIRHLLSMSTGMRKMSGFEGNWIVDFLKNPIIDKPGTNFFYNSVGSTLLGEIIRRKTGMGLNDYLAKYLYKKIGMDEERIKWLTLKDGLEIGGSGLYTTLDNNTRLGILYLNHGAWEGEQIINREFCCLASTKRIDNSIEGKKPGDGRVGYGYQMWMGLHRNTYCMCGALGQYTLICPDEDMVISFCGRTSDIKQASSEELMGKFWRFLDTGIGKISEDGRHEECKKILDCLSLPAVYWNPYGDRKEYEAAWKICDGELNLDMTTGGIMRPYFQTSPIEKFRISFKKDEMFFVFKNQRGWTSLCAGMDGNERLNEMETPPFPCKKVSASAAFVNEKLTIHLRWLETCYSAKLFFSRTKEGLYIEKEYEDADPAGGNISYRAWALWET